MESHRRTFAVDLSGERLDRFLSSRIAELSRAHLQRLIRDGRVQVDGVEAKASRRVVQGERVTIDLPAPSGPLLHAEQISLNVLYEDADVIVVDKPPGMVVHPGNGVTTGTLVQALLARCPELAAFEDTLRPGIVHRLDKDTSGVMVVAKTLAAQQQLAAQFAARTVKKLYVALLHGTLESSRGMIEAGIGRNRSTPTQMQVAGRAARSARTAYRILRRFRSYTLVEAQPITGRTHQIRLHFAALGHPIVGDKTYGRRQESLGLQRQFLHARSLTFNLPADGAPHEFHSEVPQELRVVLDQLEEEV